jgi:hypothetical protein
MTGKIDIFPPGSKVPLPEPETPAARRKRIFADVCILALGLLTLAAEIFPIVLLIWP